MSREYYEDLHLKSVNHYYKIVILVNTEPKMWPLQQLITKLNYGAERPDKKRII